MARLLKHVLDRCKCNYMEFHLFITILYSSKYIIIYIKWIWNKLRRPRLRCDELCDIPRLEADAQLLAARLDRSVEDCEAQAKLRPSCLGCSKQVI